MPRAIKSQTTAGARTPVTATSSKMSALTARPTDVTDASLRRRPRRSARCPCRLAPLSFVGLILHTRADECSGHPRRKQTEEHLPPRSRNKGAAAQIAAHQTREAKLDLPHEQVQQRHRAIAEASGDQPARVSSSLESARRRRPSQEKPAYAWCLAVTAGPRSLSASPSENPRGSLQPRPDRRPRACTRGHGAGGRRAGQ